MSEYIFHVVLDAVIFIVTVENSVVYERAKSENQDHTWSGPNNFFQVKIVNCKRLFSLPCLNRTYPAW